MIEMLRCMPLLLKVTDLFLFCVIIYVFFILSKVNFSDFDWIAGAVLERGIHWICLVRWSFISLPN